MLLFTNNIMYYNTFSYLKVYMQVVYKWNLFNLEHIDLGKDFLLYTIHNSLVNTFQ